MLELNCNLSTTYDPVEKVWSGVREQSYYNDELTIGQIIFKQLQQHPKRLFQISYTEDTHLTKSEMLQNASKVSSYLRLQDLNETDIVGIMGRNSTHLAAIAYGCMFNGTPFHAVNPNLEEQTISSLYNITKPRFICCDALDYERIKVIANGLNARVVILSGGHVDGTINILQLLETPFNKNYQPTKLTRGIDRTMAILCSSGTTGTPKAVTISNSRLIFEHHSYLTSDDVQYAPSTLDWLSGLITLVTAGVYGSLRLISMESFSPNHFLDLCAKHNISWTILAASHMAMLANCSSTNAQKLHSLRHFFFAGGHALVATIQKMQSHLSSEGILRNAYGFSELGTCATCNYDVLVKPKSVGCLFKGIRLRVVDEAGQSLGPNNLGELYCHNEHPWCGYYANPSATAAMQDSAGWFHTGDIGYFDEDNYLHIVERKKDMLKYQGMMYYPHEIEEIIAQMPDVAEVCVFGIWNEIDGDAAAALVVPKAGSKLQSTEVEQFVRRNVSVQYKHLNAGALIVEYLTKSANGKVNRQGVKASYIKTTASQNNQ